jgi:hypothetical protein
MPPSVSASFTGNYETVFDAVCWAALEAGTTVNHADRVSGVISLSAPGSGPSWGEILGIRVGTGCARHIQVTTRSTRKLTLVAASICSFSGQEDGLTLLGFDPETHLPIIVEVDTGPGLVQTPHMENSYGIVSPPGIPGEACRGNGGGEG